MLPLLYKLSLPWIISILVGHIMEMHTMANTNLNILELFLDIWLFPEKILKTTIYRLWLLKFPQVGYTSCFQRCVNVANSTKVQHWQTLLKSTYFHRWVNVINQPCNVMPSSVPRARQMLFWTLLQFPPAIIYNDI
jgi:hypothetical protein